MYFTKMQFELLGSQLWMLVHCSNQWEGKSPSLRMLYWNRGHDSLKSESPITMTHSDLQSLQRLLQSSLLADSSSIQPWTWNLFQGLFRAKLDWLTNLLQQMASESNNVIPIFLNWNLCKWQFLRLKLCVAVLSVFIIMLFQTVP